MSVAFSVPKVEQSSQILVRENRFAIESKQHEFNLIEVAVLHDVNLFQGFLKITQSDLTLGQGRLTSLGWFSKDAHVVDSSCNFCE